MSKKQNQKRLMTGLFTAAGAAAAYFGVRQLMRWMQTQREQDMMTGWSKADTVVGDYTQREDDWYTSQGNPRQDTYSQAQDMRSQDKQSQEMRDIITRETPGQGSWQQTTQPEVGDFSEQSLEQDRQAIPTTGMPATPAAERTSEFTSGRSEPVDKAVVADQVGPLSLYLLSFHNFVNLARSHQDNGSDMGALPLTPDDRLRAKETLDSLGEQVLDEGPTGAKGNSLDSRVRRLMMRVRDALQNEQYTNQDLFRVYDEIRAEACAVMVEVEKVVPGAGVGFSQLREAYECR